MHARPFIGLTRLFVMDGWRSGCLMKSPSLGRIQMIQKLIITQNTGALDCTELPTPSDELLRA